MAILRPGPGPPRSAPKTCRPASPQPWRRTKEHGFVASRGMGARAQGKKPGLAVAVAERVPVRSGQKRTRSTRSFQITGEMTCLSSAPFADKANPTFSGAIRSLSLNLATVRPPGRQGLPQGLRLARPFRRRGLRRGRERRSPGTARITCRSPWTTPASPRK